MAAVVAGHGAGVDGVDALVGAALEGVGLGVLAGEDGGAVARGVAGGGEGAHELAGQGVDWNLELHFEIRIRDWH